MNESPTLAANRGEVERLSLASKILGRDWPYIVYRPPAFRRDAGHSVLFLLHGNFGSPEDFIGAGDLAATADRLITAGQMPPAVIAMPDGGQTWYVDCGDTRMETALIEEFIPHVESTENGIGARAARRIAGISMGGFGSLRLALTHPELFASVALMSPAIYADLPHPHSSAMFGAPFCVAGPAGKPEFSPAAWHGENYPALMDDYLASATPLRFYVDSGAQDEFGIAGEARRLYENLRVLGQDARFGLRDGTHDWDTWKAALATALPFALSGAPAPEPTRVA